MRRPITRAKYDTWKLFGNIFGITLALALGFNNCSPMEFSFEPSAQSQREHLNAAKMLIENGDSYTRRLDVLVTIEGDEIKEMYLTNDPTCESGGEWESFANLRAWKLATRNETNRVYGKFRNREDLVSSCITDDIVHDDEPPILQYLSKPADEIGGATATLKLDGTDNLSGISGFECREDGSPYFAPCESLVTRTNLTEGSHSLSARARDKAGNTSAEVPATWLVDLTPPQVSITQTPAKLSGDDNPKFEFTGTDAITGVERFECRLAHEAAYTKCQGPHVYKPADLREGQNMFYVRAVDRVGHMSAEASYMWELDLTAPVIRITKTPKPYVNTTKADFEFEGTDRGAPISDFSCSVDQSNYQTCQSPFSTDLSADGEHLFYVKGKDVLGHEAQPVTYKWVLDRVPPTIVFDNRPDRYSNSKDAIVTYRAQDQGSAVDTVICTLDGQPVTCNKNSVVLANLPAGTHEISVVAVDQAGNQSEPATYSWDVDLTRPIAEITNGPSGYVARSAATIEFRGSDAGTGILGFECKLDGGSYAPCTSPADYLGLSEGSHAISVVAIDKAKNQSDPVTANWTIDLTGPSIHFVQKPVDQDFRRKAMIELSVTDLAAGVKSVVCELNGVNEPCHATFKKEFDLGVGNYIFRVVAEDNVGNISENSVAWMQTDLYKPMEKQITVTDAKVDILFVVDNSGSMRQEHTNMSERIQNFVDKLSRLDWQIAMTTTDPININNGDGRLLTFKSGKQMLTSADPLADSQADLSATIQMSTNGSGDEQGILATYRMLERAVSNHQPNRSFVRDDAHLAVVLISDEDESQSKAKNMPDNLIDYVKNTWSGKKMLQYHSIIAVPNDSNCLAPNGTGASYGHRYLEMSTKTGGIVGSVCEPDYGSLLSKIGDGVRSLVTSVELDCEPQDVDGNGTADDVQVTLEGGGAPPDFTVSGNKLVFVNPLPQGLHSTAYYCLKAP